MRTKQFIEELENINFTVTERENYLAIYRGSDLLARVFNRSIGEINTLYGSMQNIPADDIKNMFTIITEYISTHIADREPRPKRYYLKVKNILLLNTLDYKQNYLNFDVTGYKYTLEDMAHSDYYRTLFTDAEIRQMPEHVKDLITAGVLVKELFQDDE